MGLWDAFTTAVSNVSNVCNSVSSFCREIGGSVLGGISSSFTSIFPQLPPLFPEINIVGIILGKVIPFIAEILIGKPKEEKPEDLGMKAERAYEEEGLTPEDFNSVDEYIQYIRENIEIDKTKMEQMDADEKAKYSMIGCGLYASSIEEKYGIKVEPEFFAAVFRCGMDQTTDKVAQLLKTMGEYGIRDSKVFDDFMSGKVERGSDLDHDMRDVLKEVFETEDKVEELLQNYEQYQKHGDD